MKKKVIITACMMVSFSLVSQAGATTYNTSLTSNLTKSNHAKMSTQKSAYTYGTFGTVNYDAGEAMGGVQARVGYQSPLFLGAEVEGSFGLAERNSDIIENDFNVNEHALGIKNAFAGFAMGRLPVTRKLNILARAGYHRSNQNTAYFSANQGCATIISGQCILAGSKDLQAIKSSSASGSSKTMASATGFISTPRTPSEIRGQSIEGLAVGMGVEFEIGSMNVIRSDFTGYDMGGRYNKSLSFGFLRRF